MGGTAGRLSAALLDVAAQTIDRHAMLAGGERVLVAVSGGPDSVALLHVLLALAPRLRLSLHVLHVDHGLRPDSARHATIVRALGERLGVPVDVVRAALPVTADEGRAREARYAALVAAADRLGADRIAVGHTADDQAETVLMRVLDGAGVRGVAGIPPVRGRIIRPLIDVRRADALAALHDAGLSWVEDPSNADLRFRRNVIRHRVLPVLATLAGGDVVAALLRVGRSAREAVDTVAELGGRELTRIGVHERDALTLPRSALAALPPGVAVEVLRAAADRLGGGGPLRAWAHRGLARLLGQPPPRRSFRLGRVRIEVSGDRVRVATATPAPLVPRALPVPGRVEMPEIAAAIEARVLDATGYAVSCDARMAAFDAAGVPRVLTVRPRRRGDRFTPFGAPGERRLKSFLIGAKIPRWDRGRVPLVEAAGEILWVSSLRRGVAAPITPETTAIVELRLLSLP